MRPTLQTRTGIGVLSSIIMFLHSFITMKCVYIVLFCFVLFFYCKRSAIILKRRFPQGYVISLCGVVVRYTCVESKVPGASPTQYLLFFLSFFLSAFFPVFFCVVVFFKCIPK